MNKSHAIVSASESPTPKQMKEFWLQVESGRMTKDRFQAILRGRVEEMTSTPTLVTASPFFANEEVPSQRVYPKGYAPKSVSDQLIVLGKHFPKLDGSEVLRLSRELPQTPNGAENLWAIPKQEKVAKFYNDGVEHVLGLIGGSRPFINWRKSELGSKYLKQSERTEAALALFSKQQKGDYWLIPGQFGLTHRGRSVRRVRVIYAPNEFGLGLFIVGCMILSHPERLVCLEQLHIDCPGDEYSSDAAGVFSFAPLSLFGGCGVVFGARCVDDASERYGSASGFVSQ